MDEAIGTTTAEATDAEVAVQETPTTPQPAQAEGAATASPTTQPTGTEPGVDIESLLKDPAKRKLLAGNRELLRELMTDPDVQKELDHRAQSEAGRRVKTQLEAYQREQQAHAERERLRQLDPYDLGEEVKKRFESEDQQAQLQAYLQQEISNRELQMYREFGQRTHGALQQLATEAGADPAELAKLDPASYDSPESYILGAVQFLSGKEGKKLAKEMAKEMAKVEAEAIVQERLGESRAKEPGPLNTPNGASASSDSDFLAEYASGKTNDHARARKLLSL